jgi:hypothetical protein
MMDRIAGSLERYMDLLSARQKIGASNIANATLPDTAPATSILPRVPQPGGKQFAGSLCAGSAGSQG